MWQSLEAFQKGLSSNYSENSLKILSVHVANASLIRTNAKNMANRLIFVINVHENVLGVGSWLHGLLFYLVHDFFLERGVTSVSAVHHATQCCWCNEELRECSQIQLQVNIPQQAIVSWTGKQITLRCCVTIAINWGVYADLILLHRGHTNSWCVLWWTGNSLITEYQFTVMTNIFYRK